MALNQVILWLRWPGVPGYPGPNVVPFKPFYPGNRWRVRFRVFPPFSGYFCKVLITLVALNFTFWGSTLYVHFIKLLRVKCDAIDQFLNAKMNVFAKNRNGKLFPLKISYLNKVIFCTLLYPGYPGNVPIQNPKPGGLNTRLIGHLTSEWKHF